MQGAHTLGFNTQGYGICFLGDFTSHDPSVGAMEAYVSLVTCALETGKVVGFVKLKENRRGQSFILDFTKQTNKYTLSHGYVCPQLKGHK